MQKFFFEPVRENEENARNVYHPWFRKKISVFINLKWITIAWCFCMQIKLLDGN